MLQGITVYRAIKYSQTKIGDWIVLPGAGGGLGHLAVQYAVAMGLRVVAIGTFTAMTVMHCIVSHTRSQIPVRRRRSSS